LGEDINAIGDVDNKINKIKKQHVKLEEKIVNIENQCISYF